jgi:hypothetical protein
MRMIVKAATFVTILPELVRLLSLVRLPNPSCTSPVTVCLPRTGSASGMSTSLYRLQRVRIESRCGEASLCRTFTKLVLIHDQCFFVDASSSLCFLACCCLLEICVCSKVPHHVIKNGVSWLCRLDVGSASHDSGSDRCYRESCISQRIWGARHRASRSP